MSRLRRPIGTPACAIEQSSLRQQRREDRVMLVDLAEGARFALDRHGSRGKEIGDRDRLGSLNNEKATARRDVAPERLGRLGVGRALDEEDACRVARVLSGRDRGVSRGRGIERDDLDPRLGRPSGIEGALGLARY